MQQMNRKAVQRYLTDISGGLSQEQVQERIDGGWTNKMVTAESKTVGQIVKSNLLTYFNLIFAILAILVIAAGSFRSLTFLPVVIANLFIGILQEIRAKKTLDQLTMLNAPKAEVVRNGQISEIPAEELVLDDIVIFRGGDQICADAIVLEGSVLVNEALLTGESDELRKELGDFLMSGSFVVSGECYARLERVGADSYISELTLEAKAQDQKKHSEMLRVLDRLVGIVGILIIPIGVFLFVQQYVFSGASFQSSILSMVAAVVGMIPEGLYLLASVALVVSVIRLASQKVLVHDMKCIEALARVDVLCVDKTGTITENEMQVSNVIPMEGFDPTQGVGLKAQISTLIAAMPEGNLTMQAMKRYFKTPLKKDAEAVFPFSSTYKYCAIVFRMMPMSFPKVEIELLFADFVDFETFSKSDFRAVKVLACEAVKKSKKLLKFTLDDGTGNERTILSGIHAYYEPEELVGKTCVAIVNLPPRPMMGIESCGMLISAVHHEEGEEKLHLLMLDGSIPAGAKMY